MNRAHSLLITLTFLVTCWGSSPKTCSNTEFSCKTIRQCISLDRYCNGIADCDDKTDEHINCSPCNNTYFGEVGHTYELEIKRPHDNQLPFTCFLNFTAGGGVLGDLVQLSFESFAVGTFESFISDGCPDGYMSIRESGRPDAGGRWCGSAWGYSVYYSETSNVNLTLHLEHLHQQQGSAYTFEFKLSYKFLSMKEARLRYGNNTQKSYRGKLHSGTYCDRLLEGCSRRPCRIQSPNYPGIYPRNVTCRYRLREKHAPPGKHALIAVRQTNFPGKEQSPKFDNNDRVFRIWDRCNIMQDFLEIVDGSGETAPMLAHLCSGEMVPEIISSGPEMLVIFQTSPYGNPFHPLPLSYLPGFELEIEIFYVNKESPTYIEHGKKCEFILTTFDNSSGLLESPRHSLPPNTTCHYHFSGQPWEVVWISFIKYYVTNERLSDYDVGDCDVQLQLWDGDIKKKGKSVPLIGQFCRDDKPKLCDHSMLSNSTRFTRPCDTAESYISSGPDLTITHSIRYGNVLYPVSFVLRYEFVDLSQEGSQVSSPCDRNFVAPSGKFYSPKITFLYGRGGQQNLNCAYHFESSERQGLKLTFQKAVFGNKECTSEFDSESGRWKCYFKSSNGGIAKLLLLEYPWPGVEIHRDCICDNLTEPLTIFAKTARKVVVNFVVTDMNITEDYNDYYFDATYEFVQLQTETSCVNPWKTRRLRGSSGEITVRNVDNNLNKPNEANQNNTIPICVHQPWLIEPEDAYNNFLYLKIKGVEIKNSSECHTSNRILVYSPTQRESMHIICPSLYDAAEHVELFSDGWNMFSYRHVQATNSRSFIIEFLQRESGNFAVHWMEVSKNPALTLSSSLLMISPPDCPHSCPELGACISSELWCDGLRHCPSGNDEQEVNCSLHRGFPVTIATSAAIIAVLALLLTSAASLCCWKHWRREQKSTIISVAEHTFLEFKNGLF